MFELMPKFEELPSAEEAKKLTMPNPESPDTVAQYITWAIKSGRNFTTAHLDDDTIQKLTSKGYSIKETHDKTSHIIEW